MHKKVLLIICDGMGYREEKEHNAIAEASTPNLDSYYKNYPWALLGASGEDVGLPEGQMGTSEANHLVMGSGRIIYQNLVKINKHIETGELKNNPAIREALDHVKKYKSTLHIKGMASPGGVHGHVDHLKALIKIAKDEGVEKVQIHLFTDGRDTPPKSALDYVKELEDYIAAEGLGRIATIGGRYWGMDRDNNTERIEKHFFLLTKANGPKFKTARSAIEASYENKMGDEFIEPSLIAADADEATLIAPNDAVIFANFRSDRARQLARKFIDAKIENLKYVTMTRYDDDYDSLDVRVAFPPETILNCLSETLSQTELKQLKITETEKYPHLTFFFNAQKYEAFAGEDRILIDSNKDVAYHDEKPEMKVFDIAEKLVKELRSDKYDFIATNFVNCDMVGHTGNMPAIIRGIESMDKAIGITVEAAEKSGWDVIITADHGNAEETFDPAINQPITSHTLNPVPFILISDEYKKLKKKRALLSDVAPTILKIMDIKKPEEMTGESLV
ncbi:MAG: 2,3-bisphosphoglycerate-independent phosphoglycerate mutase [Patescibacteria group bacterium]|jgi:2,3-bisphosphoglycerate-independent phosphoglycerate mutase